MYSGVEFVYRVFPHLIAIIAERMLTVSRINVTPFLIYN